MKPARFSYLAPTRIDEVFETLNEYGDDCKLLAGGQSLGPLLNLRFSTPRVLVDLERVASLSGDVREGPEHLWVPAMTRQRALEIDPTVARLAPMVAQALPFVAHRTIRNRGTIGGSLAHADPAAELPAVTVATDALIVAEGSAGRRRIQAADFFQGYFTNSLDDGEVLVGVEFPVPAARSGTGWAEFAPRRGDFAIVGVGVRVELDGEGKVEAAKIVAAGVSDAPWRSVEAENVLAGGFPTPEQLTEAARAAAAEVDPPSDTSGSATYRKNLMRVMTERAAAQAVRNAREN